MITQAELKEVLNYNEESGVFTWKKKISNYSRAVIGGITGCVDKQGYVVIRLAKKNYKAHRLAWLYTYGELPKKIDHINQIKSDNRIDNLRPISVSDNAKNASLSAVNTSGVTGVYWNKLANKWKASIKSDGVAVNLGSFVEFHEAVNARKNAEVLYGFHENHGKNKGEI